MATSERIKIFYVYSHAPDDQKLRGELAKHLEVLNRSCDIESWHDGQIIPGTDWEAAISNRLKTANIILLLISSDFLYSPYCCKEMNTALDRYDTGEACVIPVIMRPVMWKEEERLRRLQVLPTGEKPVQRWDRLDDAFENITDGVKRAVNEIKNKIDMKRAIDEGKLHHKHGRISLAIETYERALNHIKTSSNHPEFYRERTNTLPGEADVLHILGDLYTENRDFAHAFARYEEALQIAADNRVLYEKKGHTLFTLGRFAEAVDAYDEALHLGADHGQIYANKGFAHLIMRHYVEAIEAYHAAIGKDAGNAQLHADQGEAFWRQGNLPEALNSYQIAKRLDSTNIRYCVNTCKLLVSLERFQDALIACKEAMMLRPRNFPLLVEYGDILCKLERFKEAIDFYTQALGLQDDESLISEIYERRSQAQEMCAQQIKGQRDELEKQEKDLRQRAKADKKQAENLKRKRPDERM